MKYDKTVYNILENIRDRKDFTLVDYGLDRNQFYNIVSDMQRNKRLIKNAVIVDPTGLSRNFMYALVNNAELTPLGDEYLKRYATIHQDRVG